MLFKYRYVRVTEPDGNVLYAYERSLFGMFKHYLDLADIEDGKFRWWRDLLNYKNEVRIFLLHNDLKTLKELVEKAKKKNKNLLKVEDADTKLEGYLSSED